MDLYHVFMGSNDTEALKMFNDKSVNILMAASILTFDNRWKRNLAIIGEKKRSLFADSGMIGWIKKLKGEAWEYAIDPGRVLGIQLKINPDIVAHVDIPSEPHILKLLGRTLKETMRHTVDNAAYLLEQAEHSLKGQIPKDTRLIGRKIVFAVQGWTVDDYIRCINDFRDLGLMDLDPSRYSFAIGSVCMRKPPDLYEVAQAVRDRIPEEYGIHCYGIANIPWILQLEQIGITSCDSSTAGIAAAFFRLVADAGKRLNIGITHKNVLMRNCLFAFNMASIEYQLEKRICPVMDELFYDSSEQLSLEEL